MITTGQIEEWIHEVEERPTSAPVLLHYIGKRLLILAARNEELLAENIELREGRKVDEYEAKIANLEYQLGLLRRQMGGIEFTQIPAAQRDALNLILYNHEGRVLRVEISATTAASGTALSRLRGDVIVDGIPPRMLTTGSAEELLFVFDSGRTEAYPVSAIPANRLEWREGFLAEPRGGEELALILPMAKMTLYDTCVQVSRRGCVKKMIMSSFEGHVSKHFIGTGIKAKPDRPFAILLAQKGEQVVLVTHEGYLITAAVDRLAYAAEEAMRLSNTDYVIAAFPLGSKKNLAVITSSGKVIQRETGWLEPIESFRTKGQAVYSQSRRDAGIRTAGASMVDENDWCTLLTGSGEILVLKISELLAAGTVPGLDAGESVLDFATFSLPNGPPQ